MTDKALQHEVILLYTPLAGRKKTFEKAGESWTAVTAIFRKVLFLAGKLTTAGREIYLRKSTISEVWG